MSVDPTVYEFFALTASEAQATEFVNVFVYLSPSVWRLP